MTYKNVPMVPRILFGRGAFNQLDTIIAPRRLHAQAPFVYLVDDVFKENTALINRIPVGHSDQVIYINTSQEPKTTQVDALVDQIIKTSEETISGIIGLGGGSVLDLSKAVAIMLTNSGKAEDYQGWDLVKNPARYHIGIPTISGTGAEVSRTTVLTGPDRKLGINSDYTPFDQVILDPELTQGVPLRQWFYTGMDCFIHSVESLQGTYLNAFSETHGEKAYELCKEVFLNEDTLSNIDSQDKLMMASWHGGMSIGYSQVGIAHAMSYGLSYVLGIKHGEGNCLVFDQLAPFYPEGVALFKKMKAKHGIELPQGICANLTDDQLQTMIAVSLSLEPLWENALGKAWKKHINSKKLKELYLKI